MKISGFAKLALTKLKLHSNIKEKHTEQTKPIN